MEHDSKTVLVTGATGRQGGSVVRQMLPNGGRLRALARNPDSSVARDLARRGIEVVLVSCLPGLPPDRAPRVEIVRDVTIDRQD